MTVDDHPVVRRGLVAVIGTQPDMMVVAEAESGEQAILLFREHQPDVTLMDLRLQPGMGGVEAITSIRREHPASRFIVLTTYDGDADITHALQAGASGYLLKGAPADDLLDTIRMVHGGRHHIAPEVGARLAEHLGAPTLSEREYEVLRLMSAGKTNKEIGEALFIAESTVKKHVNSILAKLDVADRTQAVVAALRRGLTRIE